MSAWLLGGGIIGVLYNERGGGEPTSNIIRVLIFSAPSKESVQNTQLLEPKRRVKWGMKKLLGFLSKSLLHYTRQATPKKCVSTLITVHIERIPPSVVNRRRRRN